MLTLSNGYTTQPLHSTFRERANVTLKSEVIPSRSFLTGPAWYWASGQQKITIWGLTKISVETKPWDFKLSKANGGYYVSLA